MSDDPHCLASGRSSVLINGSPTQEFQIERGVRQGDPLSPLLFILGIEAIHVAMQQAVQAGLFSPISLPMNGPKLSHLLYADDVMFIGEASLENAQFLARFLRCFFLSSGLKVNFDKSKIYGIGLDQNSLSVLASTLRCKIDKFPFTYLGVPIGANMKLKRNWKPVIEKLTARLNNWKSHVLSQGGKATLLKSVLGSLPLYYLSLFRAPCCVIKEMESIRLNFFWGGSQNARKISWIAWDRVLAPKERGGLGIGSFKAANLALLSKWGWKFKTNKAALWSKVIRAIHTTNRSLGPLPLKKSISGHWKHIVKSISDLNIENIDFWEVAIADVGDGEDVSFWHDSWLDNKCPKDEFQSLYALDCSKSCTVANRVQKSANGIEFKWEWRQNQLNSHDNSLLLQLCNKIRSHTFISGPDKWKWTFNSDLIFSTSSIRNKIDFNLGEFSYKHHWKNWAPYKVKIFTWRATIERIPVKIQLQKRGIPLSTLCSRCNLHEEDVSHALLLCAHTSEIWNKIGLWCKFQFNTTSNLELLFSQIKDLNNSCRSENLLLTIAMATCWTIWKSRNKKDFEDRNIPPGLLVDEIKADSFMWIRCRGKIPDIDWNKFCSYALYFI
ncbi:hypothetical protein SSX86_004059 [Deinandra increscens subsp. villosa]|uniref:Reverse transcriptase domain-containing protein n=1 Tax=Deinandra increscens subsp. villosa TaxID=3103831 RepID=A0AAP0DII9_9ASTR